MGGSRVNEECVIGKSQAKPSPFSNRNLAKSSPVVMWKAAFISDEHTHITEEDSKLRDESTICALPVVYA